MSRDKRQTKVQNIEFDTFAPDSMEEVIAARKLLEVWTAKAYLKANGEAGNKHDYAALRELGHKLYKGPRLVVDALDIWGEEVERGNRKVRILKAYDAYHAYGDMLIH